MTDVLTEHREKYERHAEKDLPTAEIAELLLEIESDN